MILGSIVELLLVYILLFTIILILGFEFGLLFGFSLLIGLTKTFCVTGISFTLG